MGVDLRAMEASGQFTAFLSYLSRFSAVITGSGGNYNAPDYPAIIGPQSLAGLSNVVARVDRKMRINQPEQGWICYE